MVKLDLDLPLLREDKAFIEGILNYQPRLIVSAALEDYEKTWRKASQEEPIAHKKDNTGRRAANMFLREVIQPALQGHK